MGPIKIERMADSYKEYPIRCKTCNEQIACFAEDYLNYLATGLSVEEALNALDIMNPCSRIAMMNPTTVPFNMENRLVIEGFSDVTTVGDEELELPAPAKTLKFELCKSLNEEQEAVEVASRPAPAPVAKPTIEVASSTTKAGPVSRLGTTRIPGRVRLNIQKEPEPEVSQPASSSLLEEEPEEYTEVVKQDVQLLPLFEAEEFEFEPTGEFVYPTIPGIPTINPTPGHVPELVSVGADKKSEIVSGRTYLAR